MSNTKGWEFADLIVLKYKENDSMRATSYAVARHAIKHCDYPKSYTLSEHTIRQILVKKGVKIKQKFGRNGLASIGKKKR